MPLGDLTARSGSVLRGVRKTLGALAIVAGKVGRAVGQARSRGGAGDQGLMRMLDLHAASAAGDILVVAGLIGLLVDRSGLQVRGLLVTLLVATIVVLGLLAPLTGRVIRSGQAGPKLLLAGAALGRALLAGVAAQNIGGWGGYLAAFGLLALSRGQSVIRISLLPRLLPDGVSQAQAASRSLVYATLTAAVVAPLAAILAWIGPAWPLWLAVGVFTVGLVLGLRLPIPISDAASYSATYPGGYPASPTSEPGRPEVAATVLGAAAAAAATGCLIAAIAVAVPFARLPSSVFGVSLGTGAAVSLVAGALALGSFASGAIGADMVIRRPVRLQTVALGMTGIAACWATLAPTLISFVIVALVGASANTFAKLAADSSRYPPQRPAATVNAGYAPTLIITAGLAGAAVGLIPPWLRLAVATVATLAVAGAILTTIYARRVRNAPPTSEYEQWLGLVGQRHDDHRDIDGDSGVALSERDRADLASLDNLDLTTFGRRRIQSGDSEDDELGPHSG